VTLFSQTVEYALRTVVWLATQKGAPRTTQEIAEAARIPAGYLSKVLQQLVRARLLKSQRGVKGGFTLARSVEEISTLDVVNAVGPIRRIERCPLGIESHGTKLCALHRKLDDAIALVEKGLAETKISELLGRRSSRKPFCE
jgi:Rrf2 family nitric oxide-sensitive transcriptional repressor